MTTSKFGTALITGASTGIGAVYADRLAHRGYDLILVARNHGRMTALAQRLAAETGRTVKVCAADLSTQEGQQVVESLFAADSSITAFVNNAGSTLKGGILDNDASAFANLIALNVTATTVLASAAAKAFKARGNGAIINVASTLVFAPELFNGVEGTYSATKAFIFHLSQSMAAVLNGSGVRVQAVLPGATRTEIWSKAAMPVEALPAEMVMEPTDLVDAALIGFDRGETVTMPTLSEAPLWASYEAARGGLMPQLSTSKPAARYL